MVIKMKIGFIGLGNMANAMIGGILVKGLYTKDELIGSSKTEATAERIHEKYGIKTCTDNAAIAKEADAVVLAVKPVFFPEVIAEIKEFVTNDTLVISIAAGKSLDWIEKEFGKAIRLVRCMPNVPALVGEACTGVCINNTVTKEDEKLALELMESFGKASLIPERLMDAVIGVSGSSPAYVFMFIEAMADAAEKVENYYHSVEKTKQDEWEKWIEQVCDDEVGSSDVKELTSVDENLYPESVGSQVDDVLEQWYKSCLDWYDIWEEMHPQVLEHKEEYPDAELTMKLHEAEEAVKNEKAWLSLDELKNQVEQ